MCALIGETEGLDAGSGSARGMTRLGRRGFIAGFRPRWSAREDPTQDKGLIARSLALAVPGRRLGVGGLAAAAAPRRAPTTPACWAATIARLRRPAIVLFVGYDRLPMRCLKASGDDRDDRDHRRDVLANHENGSTYVLYYFWATSTRSRSSRCARRCCRRCWSGSPSGSCSTSSRTSGSSEFARWLLVMATTLVAGALVRLLTGDAAPALADTSARRACAPRTPSARRARSRRAAAQPAAADAARDRRRRARRRLPAGRRGHRGRRRLLRRLRAYRAATGG